MRFDGSSGARPSKEARRHVYERLWRLLATDLRDCGASGEVLGGLDNEFDRRRARKAAEKVVVELQRKARR